MLSLLARYRSVRDLGRVSEWCNPWVMTLNASKTKTMIVYRLLSKHSQSPPITIVGTVVKESADLVIVGVTFDSKMTFEKHIFAWFPEQLLEDLVS